MLHKFDFLASAITIGQSDRYKKSIKYLSAYSLITKMNRGNVYFNFMQNYLSQIIKNSNFHIEIHLILLSVYYFSVLTLKF